VVAFVVPVVGTLVLARRLARGPAGAAPRPAGPASRTPVRLPVVT
jgi:hypothetical protein